MGKWPSLTRRDRCKMPLSVFSVFVLAGCCNGGSELIEASRPERIQAIAERFEVDPMEALVLSNYLAGLLSTLG